MAEYTRVFRLLKVLNLVRSGPGWTPKKLAEACGVTERSVYRDIESLAAIGINMRFDSQSGGYVVEGEIFLPPLQLAADEALALALLCEHVGAGEHFSFVRPAERAVSKIKAELPAELRQEIDAVLRDMVIQMGPSTPAEGFEDIYESIRAALADRRALTCMYDAATGSSDASEQFEFHPYALFFSVRAWYAVGYHAGRDGIRTLKVNRFIKATPTDRRYTMPDDFTVDRYLGNAWRMIRGDRDYDVEVWFSSAISETIADTQWHRTQDVEYHEDGSATFRCTVSGLHEIKGWVLSMGANCTVLAPQELADMVADEARRVAALYEAPAT
jgi:predicted DNA-binding transcriptional regulator YafY